MTIATAGLSPRPESLTGETLRWTLAFWLFSYVLLSAMAQFFPTAPGFFDETRLIATGAGALCFALVLRWTRQAVHRLNSARIGAILATILPASLVVLAARLGTDVLQYGEVRDFTRDLRWAMIWSGYFGLWVSAALALHWERTRSRPMAREEARQATADALPIVRPLPAAPSLDALESVVDEIVHEVSAFPPADRAELARRLSERAGYELANDWTGGAHNRRVALLHRVAERLRD